MVACPKCVVNNTLDSGFCKKCGAVLPVSVIEEEQEKLKEIVTKGMESYEAGNLEEAMAIAEHAILTNPSYGEAYAVKGLVHERKAEYAEALDAYETVVALNPDSTIDKIKLNQLRNAFAQRQSGAPKPDRRSAALMGLAATLLFASVGGVVYGIVQTSSETKQTQSSNMPATSKQSLPVDTNTTQESNNIPLANNGNSNSGYLGPGDVQPLGGNSDQNRVADTGPRTSSNSSRSNRGSFDSTGSFGPLEVDGLGPGQLPNPNGTIGSGQKTQPNPTHNQGGGNKIVDPPVIENGGGGGGNTTAEKDPPVKAASETYDISFSNGKKDGGITNSDSGSKSSGSGGKAFQRQGQSLQRSGKTSQARDAYEKAINAYEAEISGGKGDKDAAQAGINSCKQALKNLKD